MNEPHNRGVRLGNAFWVKRRVYTGFFLHHLPSHLPLEQKSSDYAMVLWLSVV